MQQNVESMENQPDQDFFLNCIVHGISKSRKFKRVEKMPLYFLSYCLNSKMISLTHLELSNHFLMKKII